MTSQDSPIVLRALEPQDATLLYIWENDPSLWNVGATLAPYSRKQIWDYINSYNGDIYAARQLRLMIAERESGGAVGTVDLYDFDPVNSRCAVGILVAPPYQHLGFGTEALRAIADYCRTRLSLHQLHCTVGAENVASRGLFEKCGYKASGRLKSWIRLDGRFTDAYIYQLML